MKTADFLGTQPFAAHLQRRRTPRRILTLCLFSALCLGGTVAFEVGVRVEERRADAGGAPLPESSEAQYELGALYAEMNTFALALDPLSQHLAQPTCSGLLAGLPEALGEAVTLERVTWGREMVGSQKSRKRGKGEEHLVMEVEAIAKDEATATSLDQVLAAYTGLSARIEDHEAIPDRWPAVRLKIRVDGKLAELSQAEVLR